MLLGRNFLGKTQHHPTWHSLLKRASLSAFFRLKAIRNEPCMEWHGWDGQSRDAEGPIWPLCVTDWRQTLHLGCTFTMHGLFACKQKRLFLKEVSSCFCFGPLGWLWSGRSGGSFSYTGSHALCWRHSFLSFPPLSSTSNPLVANFGFLVTSCWTMASELSCLHDLFLAPHKWGPSSERDSQCCSLSKPQFTFLASLIILYEVPAASCYLYPAFAPSDLQALWRLFASVNVA